MLLLPKALPSSAVSSAVGSGTAGPVLLDPRGAFVVHTPEALFVWTGAESPEAFGRAAEAAAEQLRKYEAPGARVVVVRQGEPLLLLLRCRSGCCCWLQGPLVQGPGHWCCWRVWPTTTLQEARPARAAGI
jgi:hypothetical protein